MTFQIRRLRPIILLLIAFLGTSTASAHDPGYIAIDLGTLGGQQSMAFGINENNEVVGAAQTADGVWHAFLYTTEGQMIDLGVLNGFDESRAFGINATRQIVGTAAIGEGDPSRAFAWHAGNRLDLGTLGGINSQALGINNLRQAVGAAQNASGAWRACRWEIGNKTDLGVLPGHTQSGAAAINNAGRIVGWSEDGEGERRAVLWDLDQMTEIGTLGGLRAEATGVSTNGIVVGFGETTSKETHAFRYEDGILTDLGSFAVGGDSRAYSVNVLSETVGEAFLPSIGETQAVLWRPGRSITNINTLLPPLSGWDSLLTARGISDSGHVCGTGRNIDGQTRAFLLIPKLGLANPIPGIAGEINTFDAAGATPFSTVHVVYGFNYGSFPVPGCPDVNFGINTPRLLQSVQADETGHALFDVFVPEAAQFETVLFQAVESGSCEISIILLWTFF